MDKKEFFEIFEDFRYTYKNIKNSDFDEIKAIVAYIRRLDNGEQRDFIKYCVDEIEQGNKVDWYCIIILKIRNPIAVDLLHSVFIAAKEPNSADTKRILGTLFELKDSDEEHLSRYENYIDNFTYNHFDINDYFLILKYLFINPGRAIIILAEHFNVEFTDARLVGAIKENLVTFLAYCEFTSFDYFYQLMIVVGDRYPLLKIKMIEVLRDLYYSDRLYYDKKMKDEIKKYLDTLDLSPATPDI